MAMPAKERKTELDYMNAVGCLMVILIHVLSKGIVSLDHASWEAAVVFVPHRLAAFVVPMFLYTGAVKMALRFRDEKLTLRKYLRYLGGRLVKIYLPYVVWNAVYYAYFLRIGYVLGSAKEFLNYVLTGTLSAPFYYVIIVMQFYLLLPLWVTLIRHVSARTGILLGLFVTFLAQRLPYVLSLAGVEFLYSDRVFVTYILYWIIGLYVGASYDKLTLRWKKLDLWLLAVIVALGGGAFYYEYRTGVTLFDMANVKMVTDICSIFILHFLAVKMLRAPRRLQNALGWIYGSSYFVFLSHCLFLVMSEIFYTRLGVQRIGVMLAIRFLACYTLPFLTYFVWKTLKSAAKRVALRK